MKNNIKSCVDKITEQVLDKILQTKELHVFDFDDTLISTTSMIKVINKTTNENKEIHTKDYHNYTLQLNEYFDLSNFYNVVDPVFLPHFNLFKSVYNRLGAAGVAILTARPKSEGIILFLNEQNMGDIEVAAVGVDNPNVDVRYINAGRKKRWIKEKLDSRPIKFLSFYDDNETNIEVAQSLIKEYPNVQFNIELVI